MIVSGEAMGKMIKVIRASHALGGLKKSLFGLLGHITRAKALQGVCFIKPRLRKPNRPRLQLNTQRAIKLVCVYSEHPLVRPLYGP
jgi:hypothetical protein